MADVGAYNPDTDSWVPGQALPYAGYCLAATEHSGCIYVCGGRLLDGTSSAALHMLDPRTRAWTALPTMPTPAASAGAAVVAGRMYVPGGFSRETGKLSTLQCYDIAAGCWGSAGCAPMSEVRSSHGVAAVHGEVWAVGGWREDCAPIASVEVYSPQLNTWWVGIPLPHATAQGGCAVVQCSQG